MYINCNTAYILYYVLCDDILEASYDVVLAVEQAYRAIRRFKVHFIPVALVQYFLCILRVPDY